LAAKIELFQNTGRVHREQEELFTEVAWIQVMIGQNIIPRTYHPLVDQLTLDESCRFIDGVRSLFEQAANVMPSHAEYIRKTCAAGAA
jgi:tryptophan halogenase